MSSNQDFKTIDEQMNILKKRHLSFESENFARRYLSIYGYYSIINGYKTPYIDIVDGEDQFHDGVTFEQIYSLFILDHNIRNAIMICMLDVEEHLRSVTAHTIAELYTSDHSKYLQKSNYRDRPNINPNFTRDKIIYKLNKKLQDNHDPIKSSRENHGNVPPWILFKGIYFNTLVNFVRIQKGAAKEKIMNNLYNIDPSIQDLSEFKALFTDSLFVCLAYRNCAAHGGRIYNFRPNISITFNKELKGDLATMMSPNQIDEFEQSYGINQLLFILSLSNCTSIFEI